MNSLEVKRSRIAGKGLFTTTKINKNKKILEYTGDHLPCSTTKKSHFLFEVKNSSRKCLFVIDGKNSKGRFVNYANKRSNQNAKFYQYNKRVYLKSIKTIKSGDEILAWYGKNTYNV